MKEIEEIERLCRTKVLCMFLGGSNAYGLQSYNSDRDIMIVLDDDKPLRHLPLYNEEENNKTECFIMGRSYFRKVHNFHEDTNDFIVAHADNILGINLPGNLIYLDENYAEEFNEIINENWLPKLPKFLHRFVNFYRLTVSPNAPNYKKHYHVYRIRAMLDNLDKTGSFNLKYAEPYKSIMTVFKEHNKVLPSKQTEIGKVLDYIENYTNRLEKNKWMH